jgi:hypothetical protein
MLDDFAQDDIDAVFWTTNILPIGLVSALCLATGNVPYMYLSVSPLLAELGFAR